MPVAVVVTTTPKPGRQQDLLDAYAVVVPLVHEEQGCEKWAIHTTKSGDVVLVESWTTMDDLRAHAAGPLVPQLNELKGDAADGESQIVILRSVPMGDPAKGVV
jgi:quinol monooxygenase YgiN